jgi:tetratricopeptide (TPR) repeat protein
VLRDRLPRTARRRLLLGQAARVEGYGARRREDPLRIATWRLDATGTAEPALLLTAARLARYSHDLVQAARLARAALADLPAGATRVEAQLVLGEALNELGDFTAAEAELAAADAAAADDRQLALVVAVRANALLWGLRRPEAALDVIRTARARATDPEVRRELIADEATVLVFSGHPAAALAVLDGFGPGGELRARAFRAIAEASALVCVGRCASALEVARRGFADHAALGDQLAISHLGTHVMTQSYALQDAGRIAEAVELCTAGYQLASRDGSPIGRIWFAVHLGRAALFRGRPATARRWLAEARALCREFGWDGPHRLTLQGFAMAAAWLGDATAARTAISEMDGLPEFGFLDTETELGRAWAAAAEGDLRAARDILHAAATRAAAAGHVTSEVWLLHDVARLLSVRTVDNHLQNAYAKLGVSGRDQLGEALGLLPR